MKKHVLICGTGRSGTTLLVRIFTRLGLDTGFKTKQFGKLEKSTARAGLESDPRVIGAEALPEVFKNPYASDFLPPYIESGEIVVDHAIIPVRRIEDVAKSRSVVTALSLKDFLKGRLPPGGIVRGTNPLRQVEGARKTFFETVHMFVQHQIPITFLDFPRFAQDGEYFADQLLPYLSARYGTERQALLQAHAEESKPDLIRFSKQTEPSA